MATFVVLAGFTDQGIRNVKETISRAEAFKEMAKKSGITSRGNVRSQTLRAFSFDEMKMILGKMV
jgi:uncharacterized protein with GYD domain